MPALTDFLLSSFAAAGAGIWVQFVNNATGATFVSVASSDPSGKFTMPVVPAGSYTVSEGPSASGPWVVQSSNYLVADEPGWFNVKDYGAKGDGVTDDGTAIAAALTACSTAGGGIVWIPPGNFRTSTPLVVPYGVQVRMSGRNTSFITALGTFPTGKPVLQLGPSGTTGVGCQVRDGAIDCNNISGSIGIYSEGVQENSGVFGCMIRNYGAFGIQFKQQVAAQPQNFSIESVEIFSGSGTGAGAVGLAITATTLSIPFQSIRRVTIFATGNTQLTNAMLIDGGSGGDVREIHIENAVNGILIGSVLACFGTAFESVTGNPNVTNLVHISNATTSQNLFFSGIVGQGATNAILDDITGTTKTSEQSLYVIGNGSAAQRAIITADSAGIRLKNVSITQSLQPPTPAGAVQAGQIFMGSGVPSNANGNNGDVYFRTDTPGTANQRIYVKSAGSWTGVV